VVVPAGREPRAILLGPARGTRFDIDLRHQTQLLIGLHEREILGWVMRLGRNARTLVDVGAAEGIYAVHFLAKMGVDRVFAFEPSDHLREVLKRNLFLNELGDDRRLRLSPAFVGRGTDGRDRSLDSLLPDILLPCLIKVDVDGGEQDVLAGAQGLLHSDGVSWIVEVHSARLAEECRATFERAALDVFVVNNAWWRAVVPEMRPIPVNHWLIAVPSRNSGLRV
jgi:hypothetical protein